MMPTMMPPITGVTIDPKPQMIVARADKGERNPMIEEDVGEQPDQVVQQVGNDAGHHPDQRRQQRHHPGAETCVLRREALRPFSARHSAG